MDYIYRATVTRVLDGDTVDATIELGFQVSVRERFRLLGINAPEIFSAKVGTVEHQAGQKSKARLVELVENRTLKIKTEKSPSDKYGRYLVTIYLEDGTCVNDLLVKEGLAKTAQY